MLLFIRKIKELDFAQLMDVYEESVREQGRREYPHLDDYEQRLCKEQDLYQYLLESLSCGVILAVWAPEGRYRAALRLEPYSDGLLLTALETAPKARRRGFAQALVSGVLESLPDTRIYSHVSRSNTASVALHRNCGFSRVLEHAVYLDGSISTNAYTYVYESKAARS